MGQPPYPALGPYGIFGLKGVESWFHTRLTFGDPNVSRFPFVIANAGEVNEFKAGDLSITWHFEQVFADTFGG